jgi:chromosome partitioning protein
MSVVAVINYKGGVGKTTLTANLGAELAARGRRVLLVDLDPQASLTFSLYRVTEWEDELAEERTILRWFESFTTTGVAEPLYRYVVTPRAVNAIVQPLRGRLDLLASHLGLIEIDLELAAALGGSRFQRVSPRFLPVHRVLADALGDPAFAGYDTILVQLQHGDADRARRQ